MTSKMLAVIFRIQPRIRWSHFSGVQTDAANLGHRGSAGAWSWQGTETKSTWRKANTALGNSPFLISFQQITSENEGVLVSPSTKITHLNYYFK